MNTRLNIEPGQQWAVGRAFILGIQHNSLSWTGVSTAATASFFVAAIQALFDLNRDGLTLKWG
ncbi:MAG: hypothetical protein Fur0044_52620 [Anaerolineae bacterium]